MSEKARAETARFIEAQLKNLDAHGKVLHKSAWHYGYCELRALMDFMFSGEPKNEEDKLKNQED